MQVSGDALDGLGERARVRLRLDDARSGNQEEAAAADVHGTDIEGVVLMSHKNHSMRPRIGGLALGC
jgi:hypothetical protein